MGTGVEQRDRHPNARGEHHLVLRQARFACSECWLAAWGACAVAYLDCQLGYWNSTGAAKTFGHPVASSWLVRVDRQARILDYGCSYGRLVGLLAERGFENVEGVDVAPNLIARAHEQQPDARFTVIDSPPRLNDRDGSVDAVLLFAVLTCVPTDGGQRELVAELSRVLRPGGFLYLSDLCLQEDERNRSRYREFAAKYGVHGIFETGDGAVGRHHTMDWLHGLFTGFDLVDIRQVAVDTMNGHSARATQLLMSKR
jgi:SAM-dependent methyltransferase